MPSAITQDGRDRDHRRQSLQHEQKDLGRRIDTLVDAFASGSLKGRKVQTKLEAWRPANARSRNNLLTS